LVHVVSCRAGYFRGMERNARRAAVSLPWPGDQNEGILTEFAGGHSICT
jgi:hypothetical protein